MVLGIGRQYFDNPWVQWLAREMQRGMQPAPAADPSMPGRDITQRRGEGGSAAR
jgi:hypothetical protein